MARKARQRISYVLPLANSPGGHRLGVNGLAVDPDQSILYSGGRDGLICAWDLNVNLKKVEDPFASPEDPPSDTSSKTVTSTTFRTQVQAHTHWVNDIVLAQSNEALVSASSDVTVKVWRPHAEEGRNVAFTVGVHSDYVKCLATPSNHADWVASGGLDHKICLWDLNGGGKKMEIDVGLMENVAKGSIYALSVRGSIMASGGPEGVVRVWDPKSGKSVTKFVGHTDNVRDILVSQDGDMIMTASSDQTVKVWSMTAGRCMNTLTMHNDSVWSLWSDHPQLSVFYSTDRSGLVAKTDARDLAELDEGICIAVCQEHDGVNKIVAAGDYFWTSTSSSSINRWSDVDTTLDIGPPESPKHHRGTEDAPKAETSSPPPVTNGVAKKEIPFSSLLRVSNTAYLPGTRPKDPESGTIYSSITARKPSEVMLDEDPGTFLPMQDLPEDTIEGQNGLIKHVMLNDRKRVLTLDTAGEVMMWDLLKCVPIKSYGKRHLEDVAPEVNTLESVANWCAVDTRTGMLSCILEENHCFDAEMYADETDIDERIEFRDDQRVNLGKWVLRYLFANLIDEEIKRDEVFRRNLISSVEEPSGLQRGNAPTSISLPSSGTFEEQAQATSPESLATPRPTNGVHPSFTPGLSIGVATPGIPQPHGNSMSSHLPPTAEEDASTSEQRPSHSSNPRDSSEKQNDYFSTNPNTQHASESSSETNQKTTEATGSGSQPVTALPQSLSEADPTNKEGKSKEGGLFGKKFMKMTKFPKTTFSRTSVDAPSKSAATAAEKEASTEESDKSSEKEEKIVEDNFYGIIQKLRNEYDEFLSQNPGQPIPVGITPSPPSETPVLKPPANTTVIIQEDNPSSGGVADVYRGTVGTLAREADIIERGAPMWLGELLLRNQIPFKDTVKVSFILHPYQDLLPSIASSDGNSRLNANRMLRAKKILAYVAERIEPAPEKPDPNALKPEEYLELYCQNQLISPNMTLATLRVHVWKTGGDVILFYKSNGRKTIKHLASIVPTPTKVENGTANKEKSQEPESNNEEGEEETSAPGNGTTAAV